MLSQRLHRGSSTSPMFSQLAEFILLALLVVSIDANQRQARQVSTVTKTSTKTTTSFTTITLTTRTICGNYLNATTACRRKRQFWIDRPIVLALDEELDPFVDQILNPSLVLRSGAAHGAVPSIIQFLSLFRTVFSLHHGRFSDTDTRLLVTQRSDHRASKDHRCLISTTCTYFAMDYLHFVLRGLLTTTSSLR